MEKQIKTNPSVPETQNLFIDFLLGMKRGQNIGGPGVHVILPLRPDHCSYPEWLAFSVTDTVAHEGAYFALGLEQGDEVVTSACDMKLLRPVNIHNGPLTATGELVYAGKSQLVAIGRAWQGGKIVAMTNSTFVRRPKS